jgi:hypothetical protein
MFKRVSWNQALAEVALPVVGVGLALGADAWNDHRIERQAEAQYLDARFEKSFETPDRVAMEGWEQYNLMQAPYVVQNLDFLDFYGEEYFGLVLPRSPRQVAADASWTPAFSNILTMTLISRHDMVTTGDESPTLVDEILRLIFSAQRALD